MFWNKTIIIYEAIADCSIKNDLGLIQKSNLIIISALLIKRNKCIAVSAYNNLKNYSVDIKSGFPFVFLNLQMYH